MSYAKDFARIYETVDSFPVFSDHEHHHPDGFFHDGMNLQKLIDNSYLYWMTGPENARGMPDRKVFFDRLRFNSYFVWLERGIQKLHGFAKPFAADTWDELDARIKIAYLDGDFHWKSLARAGYEAIVLDAYWRPGSDDGHPGLFKPTFRIDKFPYGFHRDSASVKETPIYDAEPFYPWKEYGFSGGTLADYVELMQATIEKSYLSGKIVSLKTALAYLRNIDFYPADESLAAKAFGKAPDAIGGEEFIHFGNYIVHRCLDVAARHDIPVQIHTGLADVRGSNPMLVEPLLRQYPNVRFILFHSGYPWSGEAAALSHNFPNAFPNMTWTPIISTSAAVRILDEFIDIAPSVNSITWGGDSWTPEESVGAMLAWKHVVATVLTRRYRDRLLRAADVDLLARKLMYANGRNVYLEHSHA